MQVHAFRFLRLARKLNPFEVLDGKFLQLLILFNFDALAVERNEQRTIPGYAQRRAERQAAKKVEES